MKIQHFAIIFLIIIIPFSIVCRNVISRKILVLHDETRYNNIVDNASFDAVAQLKEFDNEFGMGKNLPLNESIMDAVIDRFFTTLSVNFNLPSDRKIAETYFDRYIPAIVIVGYDGLYVYSVEKTAAGYQFKLKPKIPYAYKIEGTNVTVNFTLDNYVKLYIPDQVFCNGYEMEDNSTNGTNIIGGYVGQIIDFDGDGVDDLTETSLGTIEQRSNPYGINITNEKDVLDFLASVTVKSSNNDGNLSYFLYMWWQHLNESNSTLAAKLNMFFNTYDNSIASLNSIKNYNVDFTKANIDYTFDDKSEVIGDASQFHKIRRNTIIDTITKTLVYEFNEHNDYAKSIGVSYDFTLPAIGRDKWNNTIDDISVLSFIQGLPVGTDMFYNNYSLGGARLVQSHNIFCETLTSCPAELGGGTHNVYHRWYCPLIPRNADGSVHFQGDTRPISNNPCYPSDLVGGNVSRNTSGIIEEKKNEADARKAGFYPCSECCR